MNKKFTLIILLSLIINACQETSVYNKQTYSGFPAKEELKGKEIVLADSVFFSEPQLLVEDTLCCIYDMAAKEGNYCHIFTFPTFTYKYSLIKVGRGVNEIINPSSHVKLYANHLYIADNINQKLLCYDITDSTNIPVSTYILKDHIADFAIINDTSFAAVTLSNSIHRLKIYNKKGVSIDSLILIPKLQKTRLTDFQANEVWISILQYDSKTNTLILATQNGEVLDFINLTTKEHHFAVGPGGKPELDYKGKTVTIPGKILGFKELRLQNEGIYTLFSGIEMKDMIWNNAEEEYKVQMYDRLGQPIKQYYFDRPITSCYIDTIHQKIYATDKVSEWMLSVFAIK